MDFHSLSRKELQSLCKKNKIPANITNLAMAEALSALPQVEGLDEFLNPREADAGAGTPGNHHRTAGKTSTRRKPENVEVEQENKDSDVNALVTPSVMPSSRRRAPAVSTSRKKEAEMPKDENGKPTDVPKTPAAAPCSRTRATGRSVCNKIEGSSVQPPYSTRRSVRLLEKNLSKMSLLDTEEMSDVSHQTEDSAETEKVVDAGASLQSVSTLVSEKTDELEVSSLEKCTEIEECQSHDSGSEVQLLSGTENDVEPGLQADPHDSNLNLEGSSEDTNEVGECCDESVVNLNKSIAKGEAVQADNEAGSELEGSCDSSELENKDCLGTKQDALSVDASENAFMEFKAADDASIEVVDQAIAAITVVVPGEGSMEVIDQDVTGSLHMSSVSDASLSLKELVDCKCNTEDQGSKQSDDLQDKDNESEDFSAEDDNYIHSFDEKEKDLPSPEGVVVLGSSNFCSSDEHQEDNQDKSNKAERSNVADGNSIKIFDPMYDADEKAADREGKSEHLEESHGEIEKMDNASDVNGAFSAILATEKDASSENSIAVIEVCTESSTDESMDAENATLQSSLLDVGVHEAEDQKGDSGKLEATVQAEESVEPAAGEETALVDGDVVSEEITIPKQESSVSAETMTVATIHEQKTSDIPIQSTVADQVKGVTNEIQTVPNGISTEDKMLDVNMVKENLTTDNLHSMSMRELKKTLKKLTLDAKSNCKSKTNSAVKEVERKRIALQALPENGITNGAAHNDG